MAFSSIFSGLLFSTPTFATVDDCISGVEVSILSPTGDGYFKTTDGSGTSYVFDIILNVLTYGIGIAAVFSLVLSGIMYISSQGDVERVTKAKKRIIASMVGLICYAVMWAGIQFLLPGGIFTGTDDDYTYGEGSKAQGELIVNDWKLTDDNRLVYCGSNGQQVFGTHTVDGVELYFNDDGVVDLGGWDFTDYDYVEEVRQRAINRGSATDWYVTTDCGSRTLADGGPSTRVMVFRRVGETWVPVAGYNAVVGKWSKNGGSTTIGTIESLGWEDGPLVVRHSYTSWWSPIGPGACTVWAEWWCSDSSCTDVDNTKYRFNGADGGQGFHAGNNQNVTGYGSQGCARLSDAHAAFIQANVSVGSSVDNFGPCTGQGGNVDWAMNPWGEAYEHPGYTN